MEMIADLRISHSGRFEISFSFLMEVILMMMIWMVVLLMTMISMVMRNSFSLIGHVDHLALFLIKVFSSQCHNCFIFQELQNETVTLDQRKTSSSSEVLFCIKIAQNVPKCVQIVAKIVENLPFFIMYVPTWV